MCRRTLGSVDIIETTKEKFVESVTVGIVPVGVKVSVVTILKVVPGLGIDTVSRRSNLWSEWIVSRMGRRSSSYVPTVTKRFIEVCL